VADDVPAAVDFGEMIGANPPGIPIVGFGGEFSVFEL